MEIIRQTATDGTLLNSQNTARILFEWDQLKDEESEEVTDFTEAALANDGLVAKLASAFLGKSYSHGMGGFAGEPGDLVHREHDRAQISGIERIIDVDLFRQRMMGLLNEDGVCEEERSTMRRLLDAWERRDAGDD